MCGIVGILGRGPVARRSSDALKRLEYRGYDSAGVATLEDGHLTRRRASGKLVNLEARLKASPLAGHTGIGHTRWATHGSPTESNAHPHATDRVAVVHNGIIENFQALKREIAAAGRTLASETDTEVVAHLITMALDRGLKPVEAMADTLKRIEGAFALAVLFAGEDDLLIAARRGSPLAVGHGDGEMFVGSDAIALAPFTQSITYLEDGDWAVVTRHSVQIFNDQGKVVERPIVHAVAASLTVDKGNHRHFMQKEIYEQPEVISHTLAHYIDFATGLTQLPDDAPIDFSKLGRLAIVGLRHGELCRPYRPLLVREARAAAGRDRCRARNSATARCRSTRTASRSSSRSRARRPTRSRRCAIAAPPGRRSARSSTCRSPPSRASPTTSCRRSPGRRSASPRPRPSPASSPCSSRLPSTPRRQRGTISAAEEERLIAAAIEVPRHAAQALKLEPQIETLAKELAKASDVLYLGRGTSYPLALEGALKLKEISYIHAEGYAAGELKHGPIALIDETVPVIVIAPHDALFEKTVSNMQEVAARGGRIVLLTDRRGAEEASIETMATLVLPDMAPEVAPIVYAIPAQLIAYHTAVVRGTDVDQPRNLAKSVTVE